MAPFYGDTGRYAGFDHNQVIMNLLPSRIVCLTEETTEWLYLLGEQDRIVGISGYTVRPPQARRDKPRVSAFLSAKIDRILALEPDCVLGFSDLQADIASALIRAGVQVTVFNQRSVEQIFAMLFQVAAMVGQAERGQALLAGYRQRLDDMAAMTKAWPRRPRVYFEEWDVPAISAIRWVSELLAIAGGDDCFPELAQQALGKHRIIADPLQVVARSPDIIMGSWCGKKFRPEHVVARPGWSEVPAVRDLELYEIKSAAILQPGPAALIDGVEQMHRLCARWVARQG
jgi:iron complex transport system substrate-binding protein